MLLFKNVFNSFTTYNKLKLLTTNKNTSVLCDTAKLYNCTYYDQIATLKTQKTTEVNSSSNSSGIGNSPPTIPIKELPIKPKKPLTAYFRFMKELRPVLASENPNILSTDITKLLAEKWHTVDEDKKKRLELEYKKDQELYLQKIKLYESKLTDGQRMEIRQIHEDKLATKAKRLLRKRNRDLGKPKKPTMAFVLYLKEQRTKLPQPTNEPYKEWHKRLTANWNALNEIEKKRYTEVVKKDFEKYKIELSRWEEKMISMGNTDVVRHDSLILPPKPIRKSISTGRNSTSSKLMPSPVKKQ